MGYESEISHGNIAAKLNSVGQSHLLKFWPELSPDQQNAFATQLSNLDWDLIAKLIDTMIKNPPKFELTGKVEPAPYYENKPTDPAKKQKLKDAFAHGEQLLRDGKVAAFVVAGGQGTRLGWDGPKGTYPATPVKHKTLFQCFADFLLANGKRYGHPVPLYIMTSPANDQPTRDFWQKHNYFGMNPSDVMFFPQDELPAISPDGKVLLQSKDSLALSPNGHGGSLLALHNSGAIADIKKRGITQISYFQVDNPIVRCIDPTFIGLHELDGAQMSSKMLLKAFPKEKLGNFALIDNKMSVIEYSDLPDELAEQRLENGDLRFRAGSIALHAIRVDFVEQLNQPRHVNQPWHGRPAHDGPQAVSDHRPDPDTTSFALPFHRADKKVPCIDLNTGQPITPTKPNAVKLETFVFDALPLTDKSIIYQTDRQDEFAPIKNAEGIDSAQSSSEITNARNTAWLTSAGIPVPPNTLIEIAPSFALYPSDIPPNKSQSPPRSPGSKTCLE